MMKRLIFLLMALALATLACSITNPTSAPADTQAPGTTEAAPTPQAPLPTDTPSAPPANAQCGPLAVYLPPTLASSYGCETIPEENDPDMPYFGVHPQYNKLSLSGYPLSDRLMDPHIDIFPLPQFSSMLPDFVNPRVATLQTLIGGTVPGDTALPLLPGLGAAEMFHTQYAVVPFQNGSGIRYVTMYGQAYYPVNNYDMFLSYQGLTTDGQYWISMLLPISHPSLAETGDNPPGGDWDAFYDAAETYFDQVSVDLNGQAPASFVPSIEQVDALIQSMIVTP
jgi:hypothetical protein